MAGLNQGLKLKQKIKNTIVQGFSKSKTEGFTGILGSNPDMDNVIKRDNAQTEAKTTDFDNNIVQYGSNYDALKERTRIYLNNPENDYSLRRNYNVFINKRASQMQISGEKQKGCVTRGSLNDLELADGFDSAYPNNFSNYTDAENACKLWAVDSGAAVYSLNKNSSGQFQCRTGQGYRDLTQYTKPATLYTVVKGNNRAKAGGLFGNGQIGTWTGQFEDRRLPPMTPATLLVKYNSDSYGSGPQPTYQRVWGPPTMPGEGYTGWGNNYWSENKDAWWISTDELFYSGTMGYFYYEYTSPAAKKISIYTVFDDEGVLKVNDNVINETSGSWGNGGHVYFNVDIVEGLNIFMVEIINSGGGPGGFVLYAADTPNGDRTKPILFTSGPGWVYSKINNESQVSDPYRISATNLVPTGFEKCHRLIGGGVNKHSIVANYGRNCSSDTQPGLSIQYIQINSNGRQCIQIAQLAVFSNGVNVAPRGKIRSSSSTRNTGTRPETAIDGTLSPRAYPNIYHSDCEGNEHWILELDKGYVVNRIIFYNRSDCCSDQANGMRMDLYSPQPTTVKIKSIMLTSALVQEFGI
jgi:hypothetical protein